MHGATEPRKVVRWGAVMTLEIWLQQNANVRCLCAKLTQGHVMSNAFTLSRRPGGGY